MHLSPASVGSFNAKFVLQEKLTLEHRSVHLSGPRFEEPMRENPGGEKEPGWYVDPCQQISQQCHRLGTADRPLKPKTLLLLSHFCLPAHIQIDLVVIHIQNNAEKGMLGKVGRAQLCWHSINPDVFGAHF